MKHLVKLTCLVAVLASSAAQAQTQWQVQIGTTNPPPQPVQHVQQGHPVQPVYVAPVAAPLPAPPSVEQIQALQDARIRWALQRGFLNDHEYRRLMQMQSNIEHNRRIAYADRYFNLQEQQYVHGQLNLLSAEIDTFLLRGEHAGHYYQQFNAPIPVWVLNVGWVHGRYEIRANDHHSRAYRPAPQPPVQPVQPVQQGHQQHQHQSHRQLLRDLFDPMGVFR